MKRLLQLLGLAALGVALPLPLHAQWSTQRLSLQPGWNAVFLEVEPSPGDPDILFAQVPVESIWCWNRRFSPVQFIQDPNELVPDSPDWLFYVPPSHPAAVHKRLHRLLAGKSYLIKLSATAPPTEVVLTGRPVTRGFEWLGDSFNFAGFTLPAASPPTFQNFFAGVTNLTGGPVYRLQASGAWLQVPLTATMRSGEAAWVKMRGRAEFTGPLQVLLEQSTGQDYGRTLQDQLLRIRNQSPGAKTVLLTTVASAPPVSAEEPVLAGGVPLDYWFNPAGTNLPGWSHLPAQLVRTNLAPGAEWAIRLAVRRPDMPPYNGPVGDAGVLYQSLLEVTDASGLARILVPVSAAGLDAPANGARKSSSGLTKQGAGTTPLRPGLWVGSVVIDKVSQPAGFAPTQPQPTASEFRFRLLLHLDTNDTVRLLQQVLQLWQDGTLKPDPLDPGKSVVDEPGRYVLLTDESLAPQIPRLGGAALRDGTPVGRRYSTTAFAFRSPQAMSVDGGTLSCVVSLDYDDPLNPFKHAYHPDHDNLDERFEARLPEGVESLTVTRRIELEFTAADPEGLQLAGWGDKHLGGLYRETLTGLHRAPLYVSGRFRLQRACMAPVLNNGL